MENYICYICKISKMLKRKINTHTHTHTHTYPCKLDDVDENRRWRGKQGYVMNGP